MDVFWNVPIVVFFPTRRITTVDTWFSDNGYDIDKIWADIEVHIIALYALVIDL